MERESIKIKTKKLIESKIFILILSVLTFLCWLSRSFFLSTIIALFVIVLMFWVDSEFVPLISVYFLIMGGRSVYKAGNITNVVGIISIILIVILGCVLSFFLIKDIIKNFSAYSHKLSGDRVIISMLILGVYMIFTLINTPLLGSGVLYIVKCGVIMLMGICIILKVPKTKTNKELITFALVAIIYAIFLEFLVRLTYVATHVDYMYSARNFYFREYESYATFDLALECKELGLFWSVSNHYIILVNISLIAAIFLMICYKKTSNYIYGTIAIVLALIMNYFCRCRAGYLALMVSAICGLIFIFLRNKSAKFNLITYMLLFVMGILIFTITLYIITPAKFLNYFNDAGSGRSQVFKVAIDQFKSHLILGTGVGSSKYYLAKYCEYDYQLFNYHNVVLQVLSTMGIAGMALFGYHMYQVIYRIWRKDFYSLMALTMLVYMMVNGMLDTIFFNWTYMSIFFMAFFMIGERPKDNKLIYLF